MMLSDRWGAEPQPEASDDSWGQIELRRAVETTPPDAWSQIEARRAAAVAPPDATLQIELRKAAEILARPTTLPAVRQAAMPVRTSVMLPSADPWMRIETRRASEAVSHAKTPPWPLIMAAAFGGLLLINVLNEKAPS